MTTAINCNELQDSNEQLFVYGFSYESSWVLSHKSILFVCEILSQHTFQADTSIVKAFLIIFTSRFADLNKPSIKSTWSNYVLTNSIGCQSEAFDDHSPEFNRLSLYKSFYKEF